MEPPKEQETAAPRRIRRRTLAMIGAGLAVAALAGGLAWFGRGGGSACVTGIVWQPDRATIDPHGDWQKLGADTLLIQWSVIDGEALLPVPGVPWFQPQPNWTRIAAEPWAKTVVLGLAGDFSEAASRRDVAQLAALSAEVAAKIAAQPVPLYVKGYYFPAEVDPTWVEAPKLAALLAPLPRPLWISVYDGRNIGPVALADWLESWLPKDIGVFFQDGVGVYARTPKVAAHYADVLSARLGAARFALIVEAFRPKVGGGFRAATPQELKPQIAAYGDYPRFLFDGPHYVSSELVAALDCRR
ncbi:hypothetical protein [Segnochrobactrum spirostomi]|nr:hypothetical protein [Segnochrobactrum spirostomi]